jgi:hypothetical protein
MIHMMIIFALLMTLTMDAARLRMTLERALAARAVSGKGISLGGHAGFCVSIQLGNLTRDSLFITVEAGRRLNSVDDRMQDLLVMKSATVALCPGDVKEIKLNAFCCQARNSSPSPRMMYSAGSLADSNLLKLAKFSEPANYDQRNVQSAIWALSDGYSLASISQDSIHAPLRTFVAKLLGVKVPWYTLETVTYVFRNGTISIVPVKLKGKLEYKYYGNENYLFSVTDSSGMPVALLKSGWLPADKTEYDIEFPVTQLSKGKYTVSLSAGGRVLSKEEFEL